MKNREEGDCPTYSLFYAKVQLCSKNNFSPCSKHFGVHSHINNDKYCPIKSTSKTKALT